MEKKISREKYEELEDICFSYGRADFNKQLEKYTGIKAVSYTAFMYFDSAGNYIGDSGDSSLDDLLRSAYIEVDNA